MSNNKQQTAVLGHKTSLVAQTLDSKENKQQTAVEWYAIEMGKLFAQYHGKIICIGEFHKKRFELENQAKEMEKEQAIKLYYEYELYVMMHESDVIMNESSIMTFGQFYKQTYGGGEQ